MQLEYIDHRPINIPDQYLKLERGGCYLPSGDNIINVTESEKRHLLKIKNGNNPCWKEVKRKVHIEELENGSRE